MTHSKLSRLLTEAVRRGPDPTAGIINRLSRRTKDCVYDYLRNYAVALTRGEPDDSASVLDYRAHARTAIDMLTRAVAAIDPTNRAPSKLAVDLALVGDPSHVTFDPPGRALMVAVAPEDRADAAERAILAMVARRRQLESTGSVAEKAGADLMLIDALGVTYVDAVNLMKELVAEPAPVRDR
jgi:hypothetical protein